MVTFSITFSVSIFALISGCLFSPFNCKIRNAVFLIVHKTPLKRELVFVCLPGIDDGTRFGDLLMFFGILAPKSNPRQDSRLQLERSCLAA